MAQTVINEGDIVTVDLFDEDEHGERFEPFAVRIISDAVAKGGTSRILTGELELIDGDQLEVAVKVVQQAQDSEAARERLRRELQAIRRARHRFILPCFGAADLNDVVVIVSPFVRNGNLLKHLANHPSTNRPLLLLQVADAVNHLHRHLEMVHGDLKCENVLVSDEGNALLTDFGLSTSVDKANFDGTTATSIRNWKTLRFAAPEILRDDAKSANGRIRSKTRETDVYAFGMLMLQAFIGRQPWPGCNDYVVVAKVLHPKRFHPHPGPQFTALGLRDELWAICLACWKYDPDGRPTMDQVRENLAKAMAASHNGNSSAATGVSPSYSASEILGSYTTTYSLPLTRVKPTSASGPVCRMIVLQISRSTSICFFFLYNSGIATIIPPRVVFKG